MNCRSHVCLSTPIYTNHRYNYKTPDLFSLSRIFTDLIMHNYRSNQSALMTRCGTGFRHQYGIFGGESQTSVSRNATRPGAKKDGCFRRLYENYRAQMLEEASDLHRALAKFENPAKALHIWKFIHDAKRKSKATLLKILIVINCKY